MNPKVEGFQKAAKLHSNHVLACILNTVLHHWGTQTYRFDQVPATPVVLTFGECSFRTSAY
jgi:hypothetical protein